LTNFFQEKRGTIARLYYINSAGAVLGTIAAGFSTLFTGLGFSGFDYRRGAA